MKILLVEDDETLTQVLTKNLEEHHYVVDAVTDGETGWTYGSTFDYDLIVLDVMLPKLNGIQLCQRFRAESYATPILLLTAQDTSAAKIQGLDAGADDYVVKPCDIPELVARIRALLRRGSTSASPLLGWENLLLNPSTCEVTYDGQPLTLTAKEYELLELFLRDSQHVFSVEEILDGLWSSEEFPAEATVRSHIRRLRHKLAAAGVPDLIATVHGRGYYLRSAAGGVQPQLPTELQAVANQSTEHPESSPASNPPAQDAVLEPERLDAKPLLSRSIEQQIQYGEFLARTWTTTQLKSLEQVQVILTAGQAAHPLSDQQRQQAIHAAHKLAGTLGMFGLEVGMQCARQIERLFCQDPLPTSLIHLLGQALQREIEQTPSIKPHWQGFGLAPLVLMVEDDPHFTQPLVKLAADFGLRTAIALTVAAARTWMSAEVSLFPNRYQRNVVLSRLPAPDAVDRAERLTWLETLVEHPHWASLIIGDRQNLPASLMAELPYSCRFLEQPVSPSHLLTTLAELLNHQPGDYKVMVVDDDPDWLAVLPVLLHPWKFQLTTLAEPQHFWAILESAMPDLLILDVRMPQISGLELCQALRSHVRWARLPVLFLTSLNTPQDQTQAFALGADDYLCKPVTGIDLATRICNRLQRVQAWAS